MINHLLQDSLDNYLQNGFICLPHFFTNDDIATINLTLEKTLDFIDQNPKAGKTFYFRGARIVFEEQKLHRIVWAQGIDPIYNIINLNQKYILLLKCLLYENTSIDFLKVQNLNQIINQLHIKRPGDGISFRFHQDAENREYDTPKWQDSLGNGSFIQTAIALSDMTRESGPLEFYIGSHQEGFLGLDKNNERLKTIDKKYKKSIIEAKKGDLILFHPFCVHGSHPNNSTEKRSLFINGYCPKHTNFKIYPGCGLGKKIS